MERTSIASYIEHKKERIFLGLVTILFIADS